MGVFIFPQRFYREKKNKRNISLKDFLKRYITLFKKQNAVRTCKDLKVWNSTKDVVVGMAFVMVLLGKAKWVSESTLIKSFIKNPVAIWALIDPVSRWARLCAAESGYLAMPALKRLGGPTASLWLEKAKQDFYFYPNQ